ncbi:MAG: FHA domain-containing protein [Bacteroidales bacterium]|nr:FHA domain-containing protein [Bacteroidales bacterium]MCF0189991.1 FHA domain-containing protein [Marinilabiliaceae bacterium]
MEIIVGRKGNQPFEIADKSVSGKHLKLTVLNDGKIQVEDLGSTNGTFIDGVRIIQKVVDRNTIVQMGPQYTFLVKDVIPMTTTQKPPVQTPPSAPTPPKEEYDPEVLRKFESLEHVWNKYQEEKIRLQKDNVVKGNLRMLPTALLGVLGYLISCIPELAAFRIPMILAGCGLGVIITWISFKSAKNMPEQMEKLNQKFQIDYVCPKCKQFLGFTPYEGLRNKGQCNACKTKWVKR